MDRTTRQIEQSREAATVAQYFLALYATQHFSGQAWLSTFIRRVMVLLDSYDAKEVMQASEEIVQSFKELKGGLDGRLKEERANKKTTEATFRRPLRVIQDGEAVGDSGTEEELCIPIAGNS